MKGIIKSLLFFLILFEYACGPKLSPYADGPVMSQKAIRKTFEPILQFMDFKPGMAFADVGAASGAITVMMATLMDSSNIYIQDIDNETLNQYNLDKIINFYSRQTRQDLREKNNFYLVIGNEQQTNLPDSALDLIYTNATFHVFDSPDLMLLDLSKKLKPKGTLFIRDSFRNDHGEGEFCSNTKCAKPLLTIEEFLIIMKENGFKLVKQEPEMSGYPLFGFALAD